MPCRPVGCKIKVYQINKIIKKIGKNWKTF